MEIMVRHTNINFAKLILVCLTIISIHTANYYSDISSATDKNTLYSVDLNLPNDASWKQESIWFHSVDQSIGM